MIFSPFITSPLCGNISILLDGTSEDIEPIDVWEEEDEAESEVCFVGILFYSIFSICIMACLFANIVFF